MNVLGGALRDVVLPDGTLTIHRSS